VGGLDRRFRYGANRNFKVANLIFTVPRFIMVFLLSADGFQFLECVKDIIAEFSSGERC